jgi:hypothetical protein
LPVAESSRCEIAPLGSLLHFSVPIVLAMSFNLDKCIAKTAWKCKPGEVKQCTRKPLAGKSLCGIHVNKLPHGTVTDPVAAAEAPPPLAVVMGEPAAAEALQEVVAIEEGEGECGNTAVELDGTGRDDQEGSWGGEDQVKDQLSDGSEADGQSDGDGVDEQCQSEGANGPSEGCPSAKRAKVD